MAPQTWHSIVRNVLFGFVLFSAAEGSFAEGGTGWKYEGGSASVESIAFFFSPVGEQGLGQNQSSGDARLEIICAMEPSQEGVKNPAVQAEGNSFFRIHLMDNRGLIRPFPSPDGHLDDMAFLLILNNNENLKHFPHVSEEPENIVVVRAVLVDGGGASISDHAAEAYYYSPFLFEANPDYLRAFFNEKINGGFMVYVTDQSNQSGDGKLDVEAGTKFWFPTTGADTAIGELVQKCKTE